MIQRNSKAEVGFPLRNNSAISIIPKSSSSAHGTRPPPKSNPGPGYRPFADKETAKRSRPIATATAKPYMSQMNLTNQVSLSRLPRVKQEPLDQASLGDNSNSSDGSLRSDQRVEEVRLEDVVAEVSSNEYSRPHRPLGNVHSSHKSSEVKSQPYPTENVSCVQSIQRTQQPELPPKIDKPLPEPKEIPNPGSSGFEANYVKQQLKDSARVDIVPEEAQRVPIPSSGVSQVPPPSSQPPVQSSSSSSVSSQSASMQRNVEAPNTTKNLRDTSDSPIASTPVSSSAPTPLTGAEQNVLDLPQPDIHGVSQGYPYAQYPRYYDYADPRSRSLGTPYGGYFPGVPPQSTNPRQTPEGTKAQAQSDLPKPVEEAPVTNKANTFAPPPSNPPPMDAKELKPADTASSSASSTTNRDENPPSTAFTHPSAARYPAPYPPAPYDPYAQHYPPAPGSSAAYPPGGE